MHITLTGNLGSGKSTICHILESDYSYEIYSTGTILRHLADELGISVLEMNHKMCSDPAYDHILDDTVASISREQKNKDIVFDSRLAWHFAEDSFKVFLCVNLDEASKRVFSDKRGNVEQYSSPEDAKEKLDERARTENLRYKEIYGLDYFNFSNYNLVLDSTYCTPKFLADLIQEEMKLYCSKSGSYSHNSSKILISPNRLHYDGEPARTTAAATAALPYQPELLLPCTPDGSDYRVLSGFKALEELITEGIPLVQISLD